MAIIQTKVDMPLADTEYSFNIPANTSKLLFKLRSMGNELRYYFNQSTGATKYFTLGQGSTRQMDDTEAGQIKTIYFKSSGNDDVVEIEYEN